MDVKYMELGFDMEKENNIKLVKIHIKIHHIFNENSDPKKV